MSVIDEITVERKRQTEVENWSSEHDDLHDDRSLARVAGCYALAASYEDSARQHLLDGMVPIQWPPSWSIEWWKPTNRRRDLIKAAALIVAEIERLDRMKELIE